MSPTIPPTAGSSARPAQPAILVEVEAVEWLIPKLTRIVFTGAAGQGFSAGAFTDEYVKLQLPAPGADYAAPFDVEEVRARLPREKWPRTRTYTVRSWDPEADRLTIDFLVHGDKGVAGPWAAAAKVGDKLQLRGPGGAYSPDPDADWHLMVGDLSAVPAIAASLSRVPAGRPVRALLQVDGPGEELPMESPGELQVTWLHGSDAEQLADALRALEFPAGSPDAFVHGEASAVRGVRRHLAVERGLDPAKMSASGYWKRTRTDEQWRGEKPVWNQLAEADLLGTK